VARRRRAACYDAFIWAPFRSKLALLLLLEDVINRTLNKTKYDKDAFCIVGGILTRSI
jgi:hypothetical protein